MQPRCFQVHNVPLSAHARRHKGTVAQDYAPGDRPNQVCVRCRKATGSGLGGAGRPRCKLCHTLRACQEVGARPPLPSAALCSAAPSVPVERPGLKDRTCSSDSAAGLLKTPSKTLQFGERLLACTEYFSSLTSPGPWWGPVAARCAARAWQAQPRLQTCFVGGAARRLRARSRRLCGSARPGALWSRPRRARAAAPACQRDR